MRYKLGEIFEMGSGGTPQKSHPEYYGGSIPWIKTGDLKSKYLYEAEDYITEEGLNNSAAKMYPLDTVLIAMYGATIGATSILKINTCTNQACAAFKKSEKVIPEYLYYYFKSQREKFVKDGVGGAQPNISAGYLKNVKIEVRSLKKQAEIVCVLDKVSCVIEDRIKELEKLDTLIKARLVEMFGEPMTNPYGWERHRFDSLCENLDARRKPITASERIEGIYPYYGASGVVDHVADYLFDEDILLVSEDGANLLMRSTPIAFSVSGKVWVNNHAHVVRFEKMSMQKYIEVYFSMIDISEQITGSAQPKLNQAKLNAMMFAVPDETRLEEFLLFINQVDKSKLINDTIKIQKTNLLMRKMVRRNARWQISNF